MKNVIITGASGLTGRELVKMLLRSGGYRVYSVGRTPVSGTEFVPMDFLKPMDTTLLPPRAEIIIHLAQSDNHNDFPAQGRALFQANIASTFSLLDYARNIGVNKFVYASSGGIYAPSAEALSEDSPITPENQLSFYLNTKLCGECLCNAYEQYFNIIRLRPFFIYGPGQKKHAFMQRMIYNVLSGVPITLDGKDGIRVNPIHVSDAAMCFYLAVSLDGNNTVNIAGPEILSVREIANCIGEAVKKEPVFTQTARQAKDIIADTTRMESLFNKVKTNVRDGILTMLYEQKQC